MSHEHAFEADCVCQCGKSMWEYVAELERSIKVLMRRCGEPETCLLKGSSLGYAALDDMPKLVDILSKGN